MKEHRTNRLMKNTNSVVRCTRSPSWCEITGLLATRTDYSLYNEIRNELLLVQGKSGNKFLISYLRAKFTFMRNRSDNDDLAMVTLLQGYLAARYLGEGKASIKEVKLLARTMNNYNIGNISIVYSQLYYRLAMFYLYKRKLGTAYHSIQNAVMHIQTQAPSTWTAAVYFTQACVYDVIAHVLPKARKKYCDEALRCLRNSIDHYKYMQHDWWEFIWYIVHMVNIMLDLPTLFTLDVFPDSHIVLQYGNQCNIKMMDIHKAENHVTTIKQHKHKTVAEELSLITEWISIAEIFINVRKTQLHMQGKRHSFAQTSLDMAIKQYNDWSDKCREWGGSWYNKTPILQEDVNNLLQMLADEIHLAVSVRNTLYNTHPVHVFNESSVSCSPGSELL